MFQKLKPLEFTWRGNTNITVPRTLQLAVLPRVADNGAGAVHLGGAPGGTVCRLRGGAGAVALAAVGEGEHAVPTIHCLAAAISAK